MIMEYSSKTLYYCLRFIHRLWGRLMPEEYTDDRIIFRLSSDDSIELDKLSDGFAGLARQYRRHLEDSGINPDEAPAKLVVTRMRSGSVEFELATLAALYGYMHLAADGFVIWSDFYERIKRTMEYLVGLGPRPDSYDLEDVKDFDAFLSTVAGKKGSGLSIKRAKFHQRSKRRETLAEFDFTESDLTAAHMRLGSELTGMVPNDPPDTKHHRLKRRVRFVWHRTDREKGRTGGQTSDRGVVSEVTEKPLPVFFAAVTDDYKDRMIRTRSNPFDIVYLVDVSVEYDEMEQPKSYTILNIHTDKS